MSHANQAAKLLQQHLKAMAITCWTEGDLVRFDRWPSLAFRISGATADYLTTGGIVTHLDIEIELNPKIPASFITTCCTGMGPDLQASMVDGLDGWLQADGSVIFSVLNQQAVMNTAWCPKGDPFGVPKWDCFLSPYIVRGDDRDQQTLIDFVQANPLLDPLREALDQHMDRQRLIQSASIFRGIASGEQYADCRINGQNVADLDVLLLETDWPIAEVTFGTVRQSLVLLNPLTNSE
ncbi:MAG: DUF6348 family protein [Chloroflexota bacterium]